MADSVVIVELLVDAGPAIAGANAAVGPLEAVAAAAQGAAAAGAVGVGSLSTASSSAASAATSSAAAFTAQEAAIARQSLAVGGSYGALTQLAKITNDVEGAQRSVTAAVA